MLLKTPGVYLIAVFFLPIISFAQSPLDSCVTNTFQKELVDSNTNLDFRSIRNIIETRDSGLVMSGKSFSHLTYPTNGETYYDTCFLTKLNKAGNIIWSKIYKDSSGLNKVLELNDSSFVLASYGNSNESFNVTKIDEAGNFLWRKEYFDTIPGALSFMYDLKQTQDGNLLGTGGATWGFFVTKLDTAGNILWAKDYERRFFNGEGWGWGGMNRFHQIHEAPDGYIIMILANGSNSNDEFGLNIIKIDKQTGNLIWTKVIGIPNYNFFSNGLVSTPEGPVLFSSARNFAYNRRVVALIKINNDGNLISAVKVNGLTGGQGFVETIDNKIVLAATDSNSLTSTPYTLYQLNADLELEWAKKYFIPLDSISLARTSPSLLQTKDKGLLIFLNRRNTANTKTYTYLLKIDKTGNAGDCENINVPLEVEALSPIVTDVDYDVYDRTLRFTNTALQFYDKSLTTNTICERNTYCDSIKLFGPDSTCSLSDSLQFRVYRNPGCFTTPIWKLADTSFGTIIVGSDSTMKIRFRKTGTVLLRVLLPTACETLQDSMLLHIFRPSDSLNIGSDKTYCGTTPTFNFDAGAGFKGYQWQDGTLNQTLSVNTAGVYYVTVTDYCNNTFTDTVRVTAVNPQQIDIGPDKSICRGDSVLLLNPTGFNSYSWVPQYNIITPNAGATVFPAVTTKYYLYAFNTPGCVSVDSVLITVNNNPTVNLGADTSLCSGDSKTLNAGSGFSQYAWNTGAVSQQIIASTASLFWVKVTDANGCKASDSMSVLNVYPLPVVSLARNSFLCSGTSLLLDAGGGASAYLWQDGTSNQTFTVSNIGKYWVTVTSINNCKASDTAEIKMIRPNPSDFVVLDTSFCKSMSIILSPTKSYPGYLWSTGATCSSIPVTTAGSYWLQVTDGYGCKGKSFISITTKDCINKIFFPSAFTPNADTKNDVFRPSVTGVIARFRLIVYNRYGELIFSTENYAEGWDGAIKGAKQNTGAFTWYSSYQFLNETPQSQKGTVTLIR